MEEVRLNPKFMPHDFDKVGDCHSRNIVIFWEKIIDCQLLYEPEILKIFIPHAEIIVPPTLELINKVDHIWHKTQLSIEAFKKFAPNAAHLFTGFTSIDPNIMVSSYTQFAHFRGKASNRHSKEILAVWKDNPHYPNLKYHFYQEMSGTWEEPFEFTSWLTYRNISIMAGKIDRSFYYDQLSQCGVHLCLSGIEGFGHYINEARAMGAVPVVIDASPMNEFIDSNCGVLIPSASHHKIGLVTRHVVTQDQIKLAIDKIIALPQSHLKELGREARKRYLTEGQLFKERLAFLIDLFRNDTQWPAKYP